ncbi:hypothetical protein C3K47_09530 [Solitalea longa]|uniref:TonB-dependent receptor plug domain-containing protein n=1 Tax=Solitalea longa TaxID=2079460 RepID=A0A2S5A207_9SPHI|nr:SusC/RagA family TonB-linked outer membrane protein [Solitalea longa]POY36606.1 hypothetical protein C3K47_09530 [Solitalea longa]
MKHKLLYSYLLLALLSLLGSQVTLAQTKTLVSGTVLEDGTKIPVAGATVSIKGTRDAIQTDADGKFKLNTKAKFPFRLVIQYVGYITKEVQVFDLEDGEINILLRSRNQLSEVVVTALGIESNRKSINTSIARIDKKEILAAKETNVVTALSGKVTGVQVQNSGGSPGGSSTIRIRGNNSVLGNNSPLFVVDGIPVDNSVQDILPTISNAFSLATPSNRAIDINSEDIDNVSILKGPAAAALYGIRAANGAVIINTKKGSDVDKKFSVSYTGSASFDEVNRRLQPRQNIYSNGLNGLYVVPGQPGSDENWGARIDSLTYSEVSSGFDKNGLIVGKSSPISNGKPVNYYDNINNFFETGKTYNNNISVTGNLDKGGYYFSYSNLDQTGIIPTTNFYRNTFRANADYKVTDALKLSTGLNYINSGSDNRALMGGFNTNVVRALVNSPANFDITNGLSDPANNPDSYLLPATNSKPWGDSRSYANGRGWDNPYWSLNMNPQNDDVNRFLGFAQADYDFLPWLSGTFRFGYDSYRDLRKGGFSRGTSGVAAGAINDVNFFRRDLNTDVILKAQRTITKGWDLSAIVGSNYYDSYKNQINTRGDGLIIPGLFNISNASTTNSFNQTVRKRLAAGYFSLALNHKDYLFVNFTGRNEWTSTLPDGHNSFFYPSAGASFVFSEFLDRDTKKWFSLGKIRASYAQVGNDADPYSLETYFTNSSAGGWIQSSLSFPFNNTAGLSYGSTLGNQGLKPERINTWEVGTDLGFFKNRLGLEATYYSSLSKDQIIPVSLPNSTGSNAALVNTGRISNKGFELSLNVNPIENKDFSWDFNVLYSKNDSKVEELAPGLNNISLTGGFPFGDSRAIVGQPFGALFGVDLQRNAEGKPIIDDQQFLASGAPNANYGYPLIDATPRIIGDPNPDFNLGFRNEVRYKFATLSFFLDYRSGFDIANAPRLQMVFNGVAEETANRGQQVVFDGVKKSDGAQNDITAIASQSWYRQTFNIPGMYVEKDLYWLRIRDINLTFELPLKWIQKAKISRAALTFTGRNFLLSTNYSGADPDLSSRNGLSNALGVDFWTTPNTRSYATTLTLTF